MVLKFRYTCKDMSGTIFTIFKEMTDFLNSGMNIHGRIQTIVAVDMFTGLLDKNGTEIYCNDVVKSKHHNPETYTIKFIEGGYCATNELIKGYPIDINHFYHSNGIDIEVIGNIHAQN